MKLLTNLIFEPKGMHNPALAYSIKDTVMSADGSRVYFALQDVPAGTALDNEDYWKLQIDLSGSKSAMDQALASFGSCAKEIGMRVRGETAKASGNPVTFLPDAGSLLQPVTVLDVQQAGSGEPSPSNIRPFIGCDKLDLMAAGKNLLEFIPELTQYNAGDTRFLFRVNGLSDGTYYLKCSNAGAFAHDYRSFILFNEGLDTQLFTIPYVLDDVIQITNAKDARYAMILVNVPDADIGTAQLEFGSIATPFAPYQGKLHTVQTGQTICGGRFDWLAGKLTDGIPPIEFDGDEVVSTDGGGIFTTSAFGEASAAYGEMWCSHYAVVHDYDTFMNTDMSVCVWASGQIRIHDSRFNSVSEINAEIAAQSAAGTPVQIAYKLAAPIEIQLAPHIISAADPEQINTLYGDGRIEAEYVKPLHVSIEERVAAAVAAAKE